MFFSKKFIAASKKYCTRGEFVSAPYLRKSFVLPSFATAKLCIGVCGFYKLYVNGEDITKGELAPYISNPDHFVYYDEYDVSKLLRAGKNVVAVHLGNGFQNPIGGTSWDMDKASWRSAPKMAIALLVDEKVCFEGDDSFKIAPSPIIFDDLRMGEYYDASKEIEGWNTIDFDDSAWKKALKTRKPKGKAVHCDVAPVRFVAERKPISFFKVENGFIFDFGKNTSGICRLKIKGWKGQRVSMHHAEALHAGTLYLRNCCCPSEDYCLWQKDVYYCKGDDWEYYQPTFTYHGFRYVFVEGAHEHQIDMDTVVMLECHSSFPAQSTLHTDNKTVNQLQAMTVNSDLSNFFYFPTDCPQREKNGWLGDAAMSASQLLYNFDCVKDLREWLKNIQSAQRESGELPGIVPTSGWGFEWGNGPLEDQAITEIPYQIYAFTGDKTVLRENERAIAKYVHYLYSRMDERGLFCIGLPDWVESDSPVEGACKTPLDVSDTLLAIDIFQKAERIFDTLRNISERDFCANVVQETVANFRRAFVDADMFVRCHTQTAQAKAIAVGVFAETEIKRAVDNLVELIKKEDEHFRVGVIGARVLFHVLAQNGKHDLALKLITQKSYPSYYTWIEQGYTALGEAFYRTFKNSIIRSDRTRMPSMNHHFWGDISAWFYRYVLGLIVNPTWGDKDVVSLQPCTFQQIQNARGRYERNGKILEWTVSRKGDKMEVKITKNTGFKVV